MDCKTGVKLPLCCGLGRITHIYGLFSMKDLSDTLKVAGGEGIRRSGDLFPKGECCWPCAAVFHAAPFARHNFQLLLPSLRRRMLIKWNQQARKYLTAVPLWQTRKYMEK